ncbi:cAMP-binding domain of CRP or a regulatory subunit of cAMP-dependent protein kinases [Fodinibius roseus]|uniref:cAMP-binding domain of CRP or a regulatory subunit of cAMP-dependent protein kinases n=1 Tax=Fodinibius roseus TaxID=1194090 RepID=A0A1M4YS66_9BACT|nr:Crp/Fnr family transcriptional regulator [Fodinibius roseus]SHF08543.1 cAMP-binding domain of CRP or a regulatory subunit of cAMP-dependent protein kinases [Fodinibius roseus]
MEINKEKYISKLRTKFESYSRVSDNSWAMIESLVRFQTLEEGEILLREGQVARDFHFICKGALRAFVTDYDGNVYNKNLFLDGRFAGSKVSLLKKAPSEFTLEALEDSIIINLDYFKYRKLIDEHQDLKDFYIAYLEKNWILDKEQREISLVMENATQRYQKLLDRHPDIDNRIAQRHIAAHLGITPTQLSRIRKKLNNNR